MNYVIKRLVVLMLMMNLGGCLQSTSANKTPSSTDWQTHYYIVKGTSITTDKGEIITKTDGFFVPYDDYKEMFK